MIIFVRFHLKSVVESVAAFREMVFRGERNYSAEMSKLALTTRSLTVRATDSPGNDKKLTTLGSLRRPFRMCFVGSIEYPRRGISERRNRRIPSKQKQLVGSR